jgi:DNA-binding MarR family transcriptional regulator
MEQWRMNKKTCETPWSQLNAQGDGLTVDDFITTLMSQVGNALRRTITVPYAEKHDLTVSEWRLLALIAHSKRLAFSDLVVQSTSDKALVSRALKRLQAKGLVDLQGEGNTPRKKIFCRITEQGEALHAQVMPLARASQAAAIRALPEDERNAMYRALMRLRAHCEQTATGSAEDEAGLE